MKLMRKWLCILLTILLTGCSTLRMDRQGERGVTTTDPDQGTRQETSEDNAHFPTKASRKVFRIPDKTSQEVSLAVTTVPVVNEPESATSPISTESQTGTTETTGTTQDSPLAAGTYTIQSGDTLYSLARKFNTTIEAITALNGIIDETRIDVGQVIQIPDGSTEAPPVIQQPAAPLQGDYSSLSNSDLSWWYQVGPPSTIPSDVSSILSGHKVYWKLQHGRPVVYLTIDQGYEFENNTSKILETLKDKGVKATFFVTGSYVNSNPALIRQMVDEGHQLGNHSIHHYRASTALDQGETLFIDDIVDLNQQVPEMTMLHRPPEGGYSERSLKILDDLGYTTVFWSFAYRDWLTDDQPDPATAKQTILNNLHPGSIMLLHAVSNTNVAILGDVIDGIYAAGYTIELLPE